jgi:hypothetical protein
LQKEVDQAAKLSEDTDERVKVWYCCHC